jgi:hypothetical protein
MDLPTMRARVRKDLHDEDSTSYRWTDDILDRHIARAVYDFSLSIPREAKATLQTTPGSREIDISSLSDRVSIEAVEYPVDQYPQVFVRYQLWGNILTLLVDSEPSAAENVYIYYSRQHTLDATTSTLPPHLEDLVALGAAAYAALEWANYAQNRVNVGGDDVWRRYLVWGRERMAQFHKELKRYGYKNRVRARTLYKPALPIKSQSSDWGPGG